MSVSLQINLAPNDYPHVKYLLKHQLDALKSQVDEILLVIDTKASKGRFAEGWKENDNALKEFLKQEVVPNYTVRIEYVDYRETTKKEIAKVFFGIDTIPDKDFRGGPFYAYFFGLFKSKSRYVFHLDSDMFLGGGSDKWISEALHYFEEFPNCLIISPLPGPPHPEEILINQNIIAKIGNYSFQLAGMSTRIFLIDKSKFENHKLTLVKPDLRSQVKAVVERNSNAQLPERIIEAYMHKNQFIRVDFLGKGAGMWSLHPPYRNENFYSGLPLLLNRMNKMDFPSSQYGYYDIVDEVCDWSSAREKIKNNRWWNRILKFGK